MNRRTGIDQLCRPSTQDTGWRRNVHGGRTRGRPVGRRCNCGTSMSATSNGGTAAAPENSGHVFVAGRPCNWYARINDVFARNRRCHRCRRVDTSQRERDRGRRNDDRVCLRSARPFSGAASKCRARYQPKYCDCPNASIHLGWPERGAANLGSAKRVVKALANAWVEPSRRKRNLIRNLSWCHRA